MFNDEESDHEEEEGLDDSEDTETLLKNMSIECEQADTLEPDQEFNIHEFTATTRYRLDSY
jgi:hypothetical protein